MDSKFKEILNVENFKARTDMRLLGGYYTPDKIVEDEDTDAVIFFESSSTGDRKAHIGELTQFLSYVNLGVETRRNIYYVLFLCGQSKNSPTVEKEQERLRYYFENYTMKIGERSKIKGLYIANQKGVKIEDLTLEKIKEFNRIDSYE